MSDNAFTLVAIAVLACPYIPSWWNGKLRLRARWRRRRREKGAWLRHLEGLAIFFVLILWNSSKNWLFGFFQVLYAVLGRLG